MTEIGKGSGSARCDRCGCDNSRSLRFCRDCGNQLPPPGLEAPQNLPAHPTTCAACGYGNPEAGRFCVNCGQSIIPLADRELEAAKRLGKPEEPPRVCARCQGGNAPHMVFCQFCGARLVSAEAAAITSAIPGASSPSKVGKTAWLVVVTQNGTSGRRYDLATEQIDIGREEGGIQLPGDPYISPRHARILRREGRFFVRDLSSVNGVYLRIRAGERLQHADLVLMGLEVLRFEVVSDAEQGLGPATERGTRVFGSPALPRYARLCQRTVEGATRDVFYLGREETVVGRESGDLVFTNDPFMSRRHATFSRDPSTRQFSIRDLDSSNGTYLAIRGEHELQEDDHIRIGQHLFRLDVEADRTTP